MSAGPGCQQTLLVAWSSKRRAVKGGAGIMNLRMPINPPTGFGPRLSMSFLLYNEDGRQAIARPHLDGVLTTGTPSPSPLDDHSDMLKDHQHDGWDAATNAPSSNFTYDFEVFRDIVRDEWQEVLSHAADGSIINGSLDTLVEAFTAGAEITVAIRGLCRDLSDSDEPGNVSDQEVFAHTGPVYYSTESKIFCAETQPVVHVKPGVPSAYESRAWDSGWLMPRTDGLVSRWLCDPDTLTFHKSEGAYDFRWFVR